MATAWESNFSRLIAANSPEIAARPRVVDSRVPYVRGLMISVEPGLELEGGVLDMEMLGDTMTHCLEDLRGMTVLEALIVKDDMGGQRGKPGRDGRSVEVVDLPYMVDRKDVGSDLVEVKTGRRELHQDVGGLPDQQDRPGNDHQCDRDSSDSIGTLEPSGHDEHG